MRVPTSVARALLAYIKSGGTEHVKAKTMLQALGWTASGDRAPQDVVDNARIIWTAEGAQQQEMKV